MTLRGQQSQSPSEQVGANSAKAAGGWRERGGGRWMLEAGYNQDDPRGSRREPTGGGGELGERELSQELLTLMYNSNKI